MTTTPPSPSPPSPTPSHTSPPPFSFCFFFYFTQSSIPIFTGAVLLCLGSSHFIYPSYIPTLLPLFYSSSLSVSLFFFLLFSIEVHKTNFQVDSAGPTSKVNIPPYFSPLSLLPLISVSYPQPSNHHTNAKKRPPPLNILLSLPLTSSLFYYFSCLEKEKHSMLCGHEF